MLRLHGTMTFLFWYLLLLHRRALADEEALWGPTPGRGTPAEKKSGSYWWTPSLPKLPSLPSLPFGIPFYGGSDEAGATAGGGLAELNQTGSGDVPTSEESQRPTMRTESLPRRTSASAQSDDEAVVSSTTGFFRSSPSTSTGTSASEQPSPLPSTAGAPQLATQSPPEDTPSTTPPGTTAPTALTWVPAQTRTRTPGLVVATVTATHVLRTASSDATFQPPVDSSPVERPSPTVPPHSVEATGSGAGPTETLDDPSTSGTGTGDPEERTVVVSTSTRIDRKPVLDSTTTRWAARPTTREPPTEEGEELDRDTTPADVSTPPAKLLDAPTTGSPAPDSEDPMSSVSPGAATLLPDCNSDRSGLCGPDHAPNATNRSGDAASSPSPPPPAPLLLVPLYPDWSGAMAVWGRAWDAHVYGAGCVFAALALAAALNLLCLPLRCPSGCGYFALVSLFLLAAGATRSFSLLYDPYGRHGRVPSAEARLLLAEAPFPCLTAAFGLVFLLLSMRSRMQLSYSAFQRPCVLALLVTLHFAAAFGPVTLLRFYRQKPPLCLFLSLVSRGAFVALASFLSAAYFVFYVYVRADAKHIYHLNNTSPTPAERYNRCPFAESRDWNRAAATVCLAAAFSLACAGLQLYAMLTAVGVAGGEGGFRPWPWWGFQLACRLCELGVALSLAAAVAAPIYCSDQPPGGAAGCWTELLAAKSPIMPGGSYQWALSPREKLAIVDGAGLGETESLPLYTLMDERLAGSLNGLDLLYHSNRALAYRDLDLDPDPEKPGEPSGGSSFASDSTADLRPPSPINLRRSIDEALFSDALFPMSLFGPAGLYRTSSCSEVASGAGPGQGDAPLAPAAASPPSSGSWRGSSSSCSLVLCPAPERPARPRPPAPPVPPNPPGPYRPLGAPSSPDRCVQQEFITVCRQIDALSICSETIDL